MDQEQRASLSHDRAKRPGPASRQEAQGSSGADWSQNKPEGFLRLPMAPQARRALGPGRNPNTDRPNWGANRPLEPQEKP
jgi:hypothetical protein